MRQTYIDITRRSEGFDAYRFDLAQLKYDGHFRSVSVAGGVATATTRTGAPAETWPAPGMPDGLYLGELIAGTQWSETRQDRGCVVFFDVDAPGDYFDRLAILARAVAAISWARLVETQTIAAAGEMWDSRVAAGEFEGLVYRRSGDSFRDAVIGREKRVATWEYVYAGLVSGRHAFTDLGTGAQITLQFPPDDTRPVGAIAELGALSRFRSGKLRNGFFVRWRDDRTAE